MKNKTKQIIFTILLLFLTLEGISYTVMNIADFHVKEADLAKLFASYANKRSKNEGLGDLGELYFEAHPFFGFVFKQNKDQGINNFGFKISDDFPCRNNPNLTEIGIFGGSAIYYTLSALSDTEHQVIFAKHLGLKADNIKIYNFALPSAKQPQQLNIFSYFVKCLDISINFDGYNEWQQPSRYVHGNIFKPYNFPDMYEFIFADESNQEGAYIQALILKKEMASWLRIIGSLNISTIKLFAYPIFKIKQKEIYRQLKLAWENRYRKDHRFKYFYKDYPKKTHKAELFAKNWSDSILKQDAIAKSFNVKSIFILQPGLMYKEKRNRDGEKVKENDMEVFINQKWYFDKLRQQVGLLKSKKVEIVDFNEKIPKSDNAIFIDWVHFNPRGMRYFEEEIAKSLGEITRKVKKL